MRHSSMWVKSQERDIGTGTGTGTGTGIGAGRATKELANKDTPARMMGCLTPSSSVMGVEMTDMEGM
jgi:hypothetical protein